MLIFYFLELGYIVIFSCKDLGEMSIFSGVFCDSFVGLVNKDGGKNEDRVEISSVCRIW